jgi:NifU-like protein involved in Fe-S cluster formation
MESDFARRLLADPRFAGPLDGAAQVGTAGVPGDGPYVRIWIVLEAGMIARAAFQANGCPSMMACGVAVAALATGRGLEAALLLEPRDVETVLGGLPEGKGYCAQMAVAALYAAVGAEK